MHVRLGNFFEGIHFRLAAPVGCCQLCPGFIEHGQPTPGSLWSPILHTVMTCHLLSRLQQSAPQPNCNPIGTTSSGWLAGVYVTMTVRSQESSGLIRVRTGEGFRISNVMAHAGVQEVQADMVRSPSVWLMTDIWIRTGYT